MAVGITKRCTGRCRGALLKIAASRLLTTRLGKTTAGELDRYAALANHDHLHRGEPKLDTLKDKFHLTHRGALSEDRSIPIGWFAVSPYWFQSKIEEESYDERKWKEYGSWWKIKGPEGSAYRIFRMSPQLKASSEDHHPDIALDWGGRIKLVGRPTDIKSEELELRPVKFLKYIVCMLNHPDPAYQLARMPALISVALGILSIMLALS